MRYLTIIYTLFFSLCVTASNLEPPEVHTPVDADDPKVNRYEYYSGLPFWESPFQTFQGERPLTKEQALKRKHIRVGYDNQNRIINIQRRLGDQFKEVAGRDYELYVFNVHTRIEYVDNLVKHSSYDRFGNQEKVWGEVWTRIYQVDKHGRFVKLWFTDEENKPIENSSGVAHYTWEHQSDGSVIEERRGFDGKMKPHRRGFEFQRIRLAFSSDGSLRVMQNLDDAGKLLASQSGAAQYHYFYDVQGSFKRWEIYDENGNPAIGPTGTAGEFYDFDDDMNKRINFFNPDGKPDFHASGAVYWRMNLDKYDNVTELWFTDVNDKPVVCSESYGGFARARFHWDPTGHFLLKTEYFNVDGELMLNADGVAQEKYTRDANGVLMKHRFLDKTGNTVKHSYFKVSGYDFVYGKNNKRLKRKEVLLN